MTSNWTIIDGRYGRRMIMKGPWSAAADAFAKERHVRELELNYAKGWQGNDVSFLKNVTDLHSFTIIDHSIDNIESVNNLTELRFLDVNTYCESEIRFSQFSQLSECSLEWRPRASSLFRHRGIRKLFVNNYDGIDLTSFKHMTNLEHLSLANSRLRSCKGIDALVQLHFLGLHEARQLQNLEGVQALRKLRRLEINGCRLVGDVSPLAKLEQLTELFLCDDGEIRTIKPLGVLQNLETLVFYGSTNVKDGDLSVLKTLPKLRNTSFQERRHYSLRRRDVVEGW